jgi:hypothetical protein
MHIDPANVVEVPLQGPATILKPVVFKEGTGYCCILGADPQTGVMGCGDTPEAALADWDSQLKKRLAKAADNDEVVKHVKQLLADKPRSSQVQAFYDQFRPVKR